MSISKILHRRKSLTCGPDMWYWLCLTNGDPANFYFDSFKIEGVNKCTKVALFDTSAPRTQDAEGRTYFTGSPVATQQFSTGGSQHTFNFSNSGAKILAISGVPSGAICTEVVAGVNADLGDWEFDILNPTNVLDFSNQLQPHTGLFSHATSLEAINISFKDCNLEAVGSWVDDIIILTDANGKSNGILDYSGNQTDDGFGTVAPSSASRTAYDNLISKGWTITGQAPPVQGYEAETTAYMTAVGISDDATVYYLGTPQETTGSNMWTAVDTFVKSLKTANVFSKLKAVYPLIGGSSSTHKWNLVNPQDLDAAYRITWSGTGLHSATGFKGNGATSFGFTHFNQLLHSSVDSESFGVYVRNPTLIDEPQREMGLRGSSSNYTEILTNFNGSQYTSSRRGAWLIESNNGNLSGLHTISRTNNLGYFAQKNSVLTYQSGVSGPLIDKDFYIGGTNNTNLYCSSKELCYGFIGEGLTETEMLDHYAAVQQLQTDLGRAL